MSAQKAEEFASGKAVAVDVPAIERELDALWRQASDQQGVMRARCWNLAAYAQNQPDFERSRVLTEALAEHVPTRTLLLHHMPDAPGPEVEAFVSARCKWTPGGGKLLCFEEITIETRQRGVAHLPSLVRALVESDTPTAALWAGRPPSDATLTKGLLAGSDVLLVDTRYATERGDLAQLEYQAEVGQVSVADVQWLRTAPLRQAIALAFDPPVPKGGAGALKTVKLTCGRNAMSAARYVIGWLASQLGWGPPERVERRDEWFLPRQQGRVRAQLELQDAEVPCAVSQVSLSFDSGEKVQISCEGAELILERKDQPKRVLALGPFDPGELMANALGGRGPDRLYGPALHRAIELDR